MKAKRFFKKYIFCLFDIIVMAIAVFFANMLRFDGMIPSEHLYHFYIYFLLIIIPMIIGLFVIGAYSIAWQHAGSIEAIMLAISTTASICVSVLVNWIFRLGRSTGVIIIADVIGLLLIVIIRLVVRLRYRKISINKSGQKIVEEKNNTHYPVMIVGAGDAGRYCLGLFEQRKIGGKPVVFIDEDPDKQGMKIHNIPIKGRNQDIQRIAKEYNIKSIIIAIPSIDQERLNKLMDICKETGCTTNVMSFDGDRKETVSVRTLKFSDFLGREEIHLNQEKVASELKKKTILITGGGGSIGSEIVRQIMHYEPQKIIVFDIYENTAYELEIELKNIYGKYLPLEIEIGSVRDAKRLDNVFNKYRPDIVFHAAAHKHVPLMETSPLEAIKNNVQGTRNVLDVADKYGVQKFVNISTDKAVNPANYMGASKRLTELLVKSFARKTKMQCTIVRFGNVLGSHGSVIPLMESQIRKGGPVTVTHEDVTRYFMTIPEACQLVLEAMTFESCGDIFLFDMGEPIRIMDLAEALIRYHGYEPNVDIPIQIIGLRPGEKLYEELKMAEENSEIKETNNAKIMKLHQTDENWDEIYNTITEIINLANEENQDALRKMKEVIPGWCGQ